MRSGIAYVNATLVITNAGTGISGTWHTTLPDGATNDSGFVAGQVSGLDVTLTMTSIQSDACPIRVNATAIGATTMNGTYTSVNCPQALTGGVLLTKQ